MSYQNILVPIDGSETSLHVIKHVVELARAFNSKVTVTQVMTLDPYIAFEYQAHGISNQLIERARKLIKENLEAAQSQFSEAGLSVETQLLEGENIPRTITQTIADSNFDLIVMSSHGRSGFKKFIMGSVAQSLMTEVQIPILVVKE